MSKVHASGLLLRMPAGTAASFAAAAGPRTITAGGVRFELEPLFAGGSAAAPVAAASGATVPAAAGLTGLTAAAAWEWHIAHPVDSMDGADAWSLAHALTAGTATLTGVDTVYAEPDLVQEWPYDNPIARGDVAFGADDQVCIFNDQLKTLPRIDRRFAWHLERDFSQLADARNAVRANGAGTTIRIAHLDTGYDPMHDTFPAHVLLALQKNFVEDQAGDDASDPAKRGAAQNPGHGTGTLGLLAGKTFKLLKDGYNFNAEIGGAPDAHIIPIRVGSSVIQLRTSTVAQGFHYAVSLCGDEATRVHVLSMSMGGVASAAWADAVNLAYEAGIVVVTAAGNNFSAGFFGFPTHSIVYPARFRRVIAACGIMANRKPYYGLPFRAMQGNWGPASKMATAMSAYTPNMPWAELGCSRLVDMEGSGTSAATPQIAAAAALYLQKHGRTLFDRAQYPEAWMRVEAVRQALFTSADKSPDGSRTDKLGNGALQASRALAIAPTRADLLRKTPDDSAIFPFLRVLTGIGVAPDMRRDAMLALEATQLAQRWQRMDAPNPVDEAVPDPDLPDTAVTEAQMETFIDAVARHPEASAELQARAVEVRTLMFPSKNVAVPGRPASIPPPAPPPPPPPAPSPDADAEVEVEAVAFAAYAAAPAIESPVPTPCNDFMPPPPPYRRLRGFAVDPTLSTQLDTARISEVTISVPWEKLTPGPVGEYLEVIDVDPGSGCFYEPVNLDDPRLLAQDGLAPSEGTPQFHQQMVYAVSSLTIRHFERALGRRVLWRPAPSPDPKEPKNDSIFVPQLRIYPHALRERNAYYAPNKVALLFGYFNATTDEPGHHLPNGRVFTCLSHDVVAHETTHAILDGMHRRFLYATNPDVRAFHEAFADIVALFQHFTFPEILRHQIASTRGEIRSQENMLGQLAGQFGRASGRRGALRDAIGKVVEKDGQMVWEPRKRDPREYETTKSPHERGAILVAAVFDAFLSIYERRVSDLLRLATGGTGILQPGAIHPDLVARLADEAAKAARHVLTMCIRALDYCPPVDLTFGEYLRAIITADLDLIEDDDLHYRVAFLEAFRGRGLYPRDVRTLSLDSLRWCSPENDSRQPSRVLEDSLEALRDYGNQYLYTRSLDEVIQPREQLFHLERGMRRDLHTWLVRHFERDAEGPRDAAYLGIDPDPSQSFEVHSARFTMRVGPDGQLKPQIIVGILQTKKEPVDPTDPNSGEMTFEGGCTIVADLRRRKINYCIRKNLRSPGRLDRQRQFAMESLQSPRATYLGAQPLEAGDEPFAALHRGL